MKKILFSILIVLILCSCINANEEYYRYYDEALLSSNIEIVLNATEQMEALQPKAQIINHYFLISRLFHKIGENYLALEAVEKDTSPLNKFYLGTLLYKIGNIERSEIALTEALNEAIGVIDEYEDEKLKNLYSYIFSIGIVLHGDFSDEIDYYLLSNRLSQEDINTLEIFYDYSRDKIIKDYWGF